MDFKKIIFSFLLIVFLWSCREQNFYKDYLSYEKQMNAIKVHEMSRLDSLLHLSSVTAPQKAAIFIRKGQLLSLKENEKAAIKQYQKASKILKKHNQTRLLSKVYWYLGTAYSFQGKKVKATDNLLEALRLNKKYNDPKLEANIYNALSHVYYQYQDFDQSIGYLQKAIDILQKQKDSIELSTSYNNIAVIYKNMGEYQKAIDYNLISLDYNTQLKDTFAIAKSYNNLGLINEETGNFDLAQSYYEKAIFLNDKIESSNTSPIQNLGNLYYRQKQIDKAKKYYLKALKINKKTGKINKQKKLYNALLELSISNNQLNEALKWQKHRDSIEILINNLNNKERLNLIEDQYQLATKENELEKLKALNKKNRIIFSIVGLVFLMSALWLIQRIRNKKLQTEKNNIELQQRILRSQMNPHFVFNVLSAIQNSLLDNEPIKSAGFLSKFAKLVRQNFDFIHHSEINLTDELDSLENYLQTQQLRFKNKFDYQIDIDKNIHPETEKIPPLLLQPFVENAIEHGFKNLKQGGKINIHIYKNFDKTCYEITDNGSGFDPEKKKNRLHAIDIFLKRLKLRDKQEEKDFKIISDKKGTTIKFCLKND